MRFAISFVALACGITIGVTVRSQGGHETAPSGAAHAAVALVPGETCMACHNGLTTPGGEDVSIGVDWRGSMMANSSRDPYWQAAVRRETIDHPAAAAEIEDECATCHMPMSRTRAHARGKQGGVFAHLPVSPTGADPDDVLAHDGVSCTICHRISARRLGTPDSFNGNFDLGGTSSGVAPSLFGPFQIDRGRTRIMQSATGFRPAEGAHIQSSEMCATCHTLYTSARGPKGEVIGRLPEQVPYLEWRSSAFSSEGQTCQSCHMPVVREDAPITSVLGIARPGVSRHVFQGGNFFMLRMLNRYRADLGVSALPQELEASRRWTLRMLHEQTASVAIERAAVVGQQLVIDVVVQNAAGHKLPTGYPSRRVWLDMIVKDAGGQEIFHSGALQPDGSIAGNDNDDDPLLFEPHYVEIHKADDVQIYEAIMTSASGGVTTGLLTAVRYAKDNRLLPRGFDKATATADAGVVGTAATDDDFRQNGDSIRYSVQLADGRGPFTVEIALRFQPIAYRWAQNLRRYDAAETRRFSSYFDAMATSATETLASAKMTVRP